MSIQQNINQILSNIGVITALGDKPGLRATQDKNKFITAQASLKDIRSNLESGKKYNKEELENIGKRVNQNVQDLYDLKTQELRGGMYGRIVGSVSSEYRHENIKEDLDAIRKYLNNNPELSDKVNNVYKLSQSVSSTKMLPERQKQLLLPAAKEQPKLEERKQLALPSAERPLLPAGTRREGDETVYPGGLRTKGKRQIVNFTDMRRRANGSLAEKAQSQFDMKEDMDYLKGMMGGYDE